MLKYTPFIMLNFEFTRDTLFKELDHLGQVKKYRIFGNLFLSDKNTFIHKKFSMKIDTSLNNIYNFFSKYQNIPKTLNVFFSKPRFPKRCTLQFD